MKKLLKISLLPLITLSTVGCATQIKPTNQNNSFVKKRKKLYENQHIKQILKSIYSDKDLEKRYIDFQEHRTSSAYADLRYSLTVYPIFIGHYVEDDVEIQYKNVVNNAKKVIENNLSSNWYWTLNNIDKFIFNFNPYGDSYKKNSVDRDLFEHNNALNGSLVSIKDKHPNYLIDIKTEQLIVDKLKDFKTFYLVYDNHKAIRIIQYKEQEKVVTRILPDLLIFKNKNISENDIKKSLDKIEKEIFQIRKKELDKYLAEKKDEFVNSDIYQMKRDFRSSHRSIWISDFWIRNKFRSYDLKQTKLAESLFENLKQDRSKVDQYINDWKSGLQEAYDQDVIDSQPYNEHKELLDKYKDDLDKLVNETIEKIKKWSEQDLKVFGDDEKQNAYNQYANTDERFFKFKAKQQYSNALFDSLNKINEIKINEQIKDLESIKIFKFSMRYIYENE